MTAIFKREVKSYFTGMIGWVIAAVSLFFLGLYYTNRNLLYASSDFASVLYTMTMILLFLLPAISMRSFAEERKNKTDQLLLTSPVSIPAIVAGKFLAEVAVFAIPLAAAVLMPLILKAFGTVSLVAAYSALLGYVLLGAACLAVGTWISALTENQILAYLATFRCAARRLSDERYQNDVHHRQPAGVHRVHRGAADCGHPRGRHLQAADGRRCGVLRRRGRAVHPVPAAPSVAAGGLQRCAVGAGPV